MPSSRLGEFNKCENAAAGLVSGDSFQRREGSLWSCLHRVPFCCHLFAHSLVQPGVLRLSDQHLVWLMVKSFVSASREHCQATKTSAVSTASGSKRLKGEGAGSSLSSSCPVLPGQSWAALAAQHRGFHPSSFPPGLNPSLKEARGWSTTSPPPPYRARAYTVGHCWSQKKGSSRNLAICLFRG